MSLKGRKWFIAGGTGDLGRTVVREILKESPIQVRIFSRDEYKQWQMRQDLDREQPGAPVSFLLGDIRDRERVTRAMDGCDLVIHAAALKHLRACEENPGECWRTNIMGAENVMTAACENSVSRALFVSTDKAVSPSNAYGASKLLAERLWLSSRPPLTRLSCVRLGNLVGSRGSVMRVWGKQVLRREPLTVTDQGATRFWVGIPEASRFILRIMAEMRGGEVFIPKMPACTVGDLARVFSDPPFKESGLASGEKLHEVLIGQEEFREARFDQGRYVLTPGYAAVDSIPGPVTSQPAENRKRVLDMFKEGER